MTDNRKFWGTIQTSAAPALAMQAKMAEDAGLEGIFAPQVYGPPFVPLAGAAMVTDRLRLASGIAIAFTRSPFETAMAAIDLDRISNGRFTLGLGCSVESWNEGFFGVEYGKPLQHLREVVDIVQMAIRGAHTGDLKTYEGKYHQFDWTEFQPLQAPLRAEIPIWIAALRGPLVSLAAEIADGVLGHPIWSVPWVTDTIPASLKKGLARGGKERADIEFNVWFWVAINNDRKEAVNDARGTVAFYGGVEQYEEYFAAHGFQKEAKVLQEAVKRGDYMSAASMVPDAMAEMFVVCGTADEVRKKIEPVWEVADSMTLVPPAYGLAPAKLMAYVGAIGSTFYS